MRDKKLCRKAKRYQRTASLFSRIKGRRGEKQNVRLVDTAYGPIRVLEYGFEEKEVSPLFVDLHGGGFVLMTADSDETINLRLREKTGVKIISIDYPKAPDFPYPAALEAIHEVIACYTDHGVELGIDPARIGIGGHSAGANLSTVTCMRASIPFRFQLLDYPPLDLYTDPFKKPTPREAIPPETARMFNACYVDPEQAKTPHISPIFASQEMLRGLPPALLIVAGLDSLHDEGVRYGKMLEEVGVSVELHDFPQAIHGFTLNPGKDAENALELMARFIKKHI